eukprot:UN13710
MHNFENNAELIQEKDRSSSYFWATLAAAVPGVGRADVPEFSSDRVSSVPRYRSNNTNGFTDDHNRTSYSTITALTGNSELARHASNAEHTDPNNPVKNSIIYEVQDLSGWGLLVLVWELYSLSFLLYLPQIFSFVPLSDVTAGLDHITFYYD